MDLPSTEVSELNDTAIELQQRRAFDGADLTSICERINEIIFGQVNAHLEKGKQVGLLGGDHSVSYGSIDAHLSRYPGMGILQIDAHCDLRCAFDGIQYSHASIMYNVLESLGAPHLVQVGIRGLCDFEAQYVRESPKVHMFYDSDLHRARAGGESWSSVCRRIIDTLPGIVYISLDVDGLEPAWCPHTGTPVPGGIGYNDAVYLLNEIATSGRTIVGFDLVECGGDPFDAGIGAHLLYQLCAVLPGQFSD
jgi:agmatinase